jgi:ATPase subunit of ABC transporter with duplicated ATPase domains
LCWRPSLPRLLRAALSQYKGTMLFVSHDRHFLAALSNRVLELTPEGIHQYGAANAFSDVAPSGADASSRSSPQ